MQRFEKAKGLWLGTMEYKEAVEKQQQMYSTWRGPLFMGFETPHPTITLGLTAKKDSEVLGVPEGFRVEQTDRGGQATLHSPGQLVIFPVLDLRQLELGPKDLVCELLKALYRPLVKKVGEPLEMKEDGLYTPLGKLAFIGMRLKNRQVSHGLSLNVSNDLSQFAAIRSCGRSQASHDSLAHYMRNPQPKQVFESVFPSVVELDDL